MNKQLMSLIDAIIKFEEIQDTFNPEVIRKNAERFSKTRFKEELQIFVEQKFREFLSP